MKKNIHIFMQANVIVLFITALFIACVLEIGFFNFSYFSQGFGNYQRTELDLSSLEGYNGEALPILPENPTVGFGDFALPARSVTVYTAGPYQVLSGNIGIRDESNAYRTVGAGSFQVNPGGRESVFTVPLRCHGSLTRLRINFTEEMTEPVFLFSVVLNEHIPLQIHGLRLLLMAGLLFVLFAVLRFRLYEKEYQPSKRSHYLMNLATLAFCLLVSCTILYGADATHKYLKAYPSLEEIRSPEMIVDAYMQQLDAFEKGQLHLDLDVNPDLEKLDNPYDKGERDKKGITYHWDRAYYNGKYYSYFGLAPLFTVYYPVYWLTSKIPTELFAGSLLTVFAIIAVFAAIQGLLLIFRPRANLLLLLAGEVALVCGSFLYLMQASLNFYYLPLISATGWLAAFVAFACFARLSVSTRKRILLFALCGISFVMLVLSRPNMALLAVAFAAPMFLRILFDRNTSVAYKLQSSLPFLIPVLIGGVAIMYYNYIRFQSVFEFGTTYQLTESDIHYNHIAVSIQNFGHMFYHYFLEPFISLEGFPFLRFTTDQCLDFGNYLYQEYSGGLFQMPLNLGVFLAFLCFLHKPAKATLSSKPSPESYRLSLQRQTYGLLLVGILALGYLNYSLGGIHIRYVCDLSLTLGILAFLGILEHVHFDASRSARILYVIVLCLCLITIGRGLSLIFSNETNDILLRNPDFYLYVGGMF